ncbi:hypothetical protein BC835DRAFT_1417051 [Cytidiella melzeri]|nr:hypothetical protein BC835DRAFT_1417051 [Cytidiella melzeri]
MDLIGLLYVLVASVSVNVFQHGLDLQFLPELAHLTVIQVTIVAIGYELSTCGISNAVFWFTSPSVIPFDTPVPAVVASFEGLVTVFDPFRVMYTICHCLDADFFSTSTDLIPAPNFGITLVLPHYGTLTSQLSHYSDLLATSTDLILAPDLGLTVSVTSCATHPCQPLAYSLSSSTDIIVAHNYGLEVSHWQAFTSLPACHCWEHEVYFDWQLLVRLCALLWLVLLVLYAVLVQPKQELQHPPTMDMMLDDMLKVISGQASCDLSLRLNVPLETASGDACSNLTSRSIPRSVAAPPAHTLERRPIMATTASQAASRHDSNVPLEIASGDACSNLTFRSVPRSVAAPPARTLGCRPMEAMSSSQSTLRLVPLDTASGDACSKWGPRSIPLSVAAPPARTLRPRTVKANTPTQQMNLGVPPDMASGDACSNLESRSVPLSVAAPLARPLEPRTIEDNALSHSTPQLDVPLEMASGDACSGLNSRSIPRSVAAPPAPSLEPRLTEENLDAEVVHSIKPPPDPDQNPDVPPRYKRSHRNGASLKKRKRRLAAQQDTLHATSSFSSSPGDNGSADDVRSTTLV